MVPLVALLGPSGRLLDTMHVSNPCYCSFIFAARITLIDGDISLRTSMRSHTRTNLAGLSFICRNRRIIHNGLFLRASSHFESSSLTTSSPPCAALARSWGEFSNPVEAIFMLSWILSRPTWEDPLLSGHTLRAPLDSLTLRSNLASLAHLPPRTPSLKASVPRGASAGTRSDYNFYIPVLA